MTSFTGQSGSQRRSSAFVVAMVVFVVLALAAFALLCGPPIVQALLFQRTIDAKVQELLTEVDHESIRSAGRKILADGDMVETWDGTNARLPKAIRALGANYVVVSTTEINIEFGSGFGHFGLTILPNGQATAESPPGYSHKKIIDGLLLYEEISQ